MFTKTFNQQTADQEGCKKVGQASSDSTRSDHHFQNNGQVTRVGGEEETGTDNIEDEVARSEEWSSSELRLNETCLLC